MAKQQEMDEHFAAAERLRADGQHAAALAAFVAFKEAYPQNRPAKVRDAIVELQAAVDAADGRGVDKAAAAVPMTDNERRIAESREALKHPLPAGQKFFEAPDGYVIVAEADRAHVRYRPVGGKEMIINPRR